MDEIDQTAFDMTGFELPELIDAMDPRELWILASELDILGTAPRHRIREWASWWRWRVYRSLGANEIQPPFEPVDHMRSDEREAVEHDLLALAEHHRLDDCVLEFSTGLIAAIAFAQLQDEVEKEKLRAIVSEYRRKYPYGTVRQSADDTLRA